MVNNREYNRLVSGFSKKSKQEKIEWISKTCFENPQLAKNILETYWHTDEKLQLLHDEFIENSVSNFYLPMAVAPNFVINQKTFVLPMVTEQTSETLLNLIFVILKQREESTDSWSFVTARITLLTLLIIMSSEQTSS